MLLGLKLCLVRVELFAVMGKPELFFDDCSTTF